jgi:RNA polymerase sigma-70 factor (ECF subfamily)
MSDLERRFRRLLDAHADAAWRIAGAYSRTRLDREDLYQDILLHAWRGLPSFRGDASERTWLTRVALNVALGTVRKRDIRTPVDAPLTVDQIESSFPDPSDSAEQSDALSRLYAALRQLSEIDRALVLLVFEERSHAEIADVLGISAGNVAVRLHRAKARLSTLLSDPIPS